MIEFFYLIIFIILMICFYNLLLLHNYIKNYKIYKEVKPQVKTMLEEIKNED